MTPESSVAEQEQKEAGEEAVRETERALRVSTLDYVGPCDLRPDETE